MLARYNDSTVSVDATHWRSNQLLAPLLGSAITALQSGDQKAWASLFEVDAELYDDGSPRSLKDFTAGALGHVRFKSIDRIENDGLDVIGPFHSDRWGDFRTYF